MIIAEKGSGKNDNLLKEWIREHGVDSILLLVAVGIGTFLRCIYLAKTNFPINDGGLFYRMIQDLQDNHYLLPSYTTYNNASLPYVYPPLSFYIIGLANQFLGIHLIVSFRYFPLFMNLLTIPVFFCITRRLLRAPSQVYLATLAFAWLKPAYEWLIMGGGVTRSPGFVFALIAIYQGIAFLQQNKRANLILTAITFTLATLSHFEMAWFAMISLINLIAFMRKWRSGAILLASICFGIAILGFPYWYHIFKNNYFDAIGYGFLSGDFNVLFALVKLFFFNLTEEGLLPIFAMIAILGLVATFAKKNFLFIVWLITLLFLDYRSANRSSMLPLSLLIGIGVDIVILPLIDHAQKVSIMNFPFIDPPDNSGIVAPRSIWYKAILVFAIFIQLIIVSYFNQYTDQALNKVLSPEDRDAMNWMNNNTTPGDKVLILPSSSGWEQDPISEWFPALTHLTSVATVQGFEWTNIYYEKVSDYEGLRKCIHNIDLYCLLRYLESNNAIKYIYYSALSSYDNPIRDFIKIALSRYPKVYSNGNVTIYKYIH